MYVHLKDGHVQTDVISKTTYGHLYPRSDRAHPKSCKYGVPYNIALRLKRICFRPELLSRSPLSFESFQLL